MGYKVAVVGATGLVGRTMLRVLEGRRFPVSELVLYSSSSGKTLDFAGTGFKTTGLSPSAVEHFDLALFSAGKAVSLKYAPLFAKKGALVVDNSSAWRQHPSVPLVVPEVNPKALENIPLNIVANPNCSTIQLVIALNPLVPSGIKEVFVATYQAASGAGQKGIEALSKEEKGKKAEDSPHGSVLHRNVIPAIGPETQGFFQEEEKLMTETVKILGRKIAVYPTAVRVPVITGHGEAVAVRLSRKVSLRLIQKRMRQQDGLALEERPITPKDAAGKPDVFVSRLRLHPENPKMLMMWVVADNLLKGAALNAVQIAERVLVGQH